ncbi:MAG: metal ABC transporter permease [Bacteroidetes bacterium]|jgi:zinc transport system permease protein|nr:metal ABC transporter permease [Bacteroidota bacterium]
MIDALSLPFMQRALVAGVLVGLLASYYGVFVVQRRLSFLGIGLSHAAFGGVALGLLLQVNPMWVAVPFTVAVALGINWITVRGNVTGDTAIGVLFAVAVALGIVFLSLRQTYTADAFAYLFGSILAVRPADVWVMGAVALASLGTAPLWGRWAYATFDRDLARADRVPVTRDDYVLVTLLAITVVAAVKVVGIILAAAFLVIPAATARLLVRTFSAMTGVAMGIGVLTAVGGLLASYGLDVPSGATIILGQALLFFIALIGTGR